MQRTTSKATAFLEGARQEIPARLNLYASSSLPVPARQQNQIRKRCGACQKMDSNYAEDLGSHDHDSMRSMTIREKLTC